MALGAVTQIPIDPRSSTQASAVNIGGLKMTVTTVVGEASYTTGGPAITPQQLGFPSAVVAAQAEVLASTGSNATSTALAVVVTNNGSTVNLKAFTSANVEIASTTNVSGVTWQIIAFGY